MSRGDHIPLVQIGLKKILQYGPTFRIIRFEMEITLKITPDAARAVLQDFETKMSRRLQEREELNDEIQKLENSVKSLREQLQGVNGSAIRSPRGENRKRIVEYLKRLPEGRGARMTEISKATGISMTSTSYTLQHNRKNFIRDETYLWRLK